MSKKSKTELPPDNPFAALNAIRGTLKPGANDRAAYRPAIPPRPPKQPAPQKGKIAFKPSAPPEPEPSLGPSTGEDEDAALFLQLMGDATPISGKGREVAEARPAQACGAADLSGPADPDEEARSQFLDFIEGRVEFSLECSDEYMHGHVVGLDSKIFRQLKAGVLSVEGHIDLHGLNAEQARWALLDFMREKYLAGARVVLIVHGRGRNSPGGVGVLKNELYDWLTREPLKRAVLAFCTALPRHGGPGAVYALLRKFKKSQGKVIWEKSFPDR
jgi:DNA-nicking Smr family endonuclease